MARSSREAAMSSKTTHSLVAGKGYVRHDFPPELRAEPLAPPCLPAADALDGSHHLLKSHHGGAALVFTWVKREVAWERPGGNRLAWTAAYLGTHGWTYEGAHTEQEEQPIPFAPTPKRNRKVG